MSRLPPEIWFDVFTFACESLEGLFLMSSLDSQTRQACTLSPVMHNYLAVCRIERIRAASDLMSEQEELAFFRKLRSRPEVIPIVTHFLAKNIISPSRDRGIYSALLQDPCPFAVPLATIMFDYGFMTGYEMLHDAICQQLDVRAIQTWMELMKADPSSTGILSNACKAGRRDILNWLSACLNQQHPFRKQVSESPLLQIHFANPQLLQYSPQGSRFAQIDEAPANILAFRRDLLSQVCCDGHLSILQGLHELHAGFSLTDELLALAATRGFADIVVYLLKNGSNLEVEQAQNDGSTLWQACKRSHASTRSFYESELSLAWETNGSYTPSTATWCNDADMLQRRLRNERLATIAVLIQAGADLNAFSTFGWIVLHLVCAGRHQQGPPIDYEVLALLLGLEFAFPDMTSLDTNTPIWTFSRPEHRRADPNVLTALENGSAFYMAVGDVGDVFAGQMLVAAGADPASKLGAQAHRPERPGFTVLHRAVMKANAEAVEYLIREHFAKVYVADKDGNTPLHIAAAELTNVAIVERVLGGLLACPVDVNAKNSKGETPLDLAKNPVAQHLLKAAGGTRNISRDPMEDSLIGASVESLFHTI